jgi:type III secretion protein S
MEFSINNAIWQMFYLVLIGSGPVLAASALAGLIIAVLQGVTQINDQTLPQVVKAAVTAGVLVVFAGAMFGPLYRLALMYFQLVPVIGR